MTLPPITVQHLEGYFLLRAGIDKEAVADIQSIKKGQLLFESDRIQACSFLKKDADFYLSGLCKAAMKKGVSDYHCYLQPNNISSNQISNL